jgi:hypothetical protein
VSVSIKHRDSQRLLDGIGSPQLLHEVASINGVLDQDAAALELFRRLETDQPELARQSFGFVDRLCLHSDPELFRRYCGDPVSFFRQKRESYLWSAQFILKQGRSENSGLDRRRAELLDLATQIAAAFSDDAHIVSKVAHLESATDEELTSRLD